MLGSLCLQQHVILILLSVLGLIICRVGYSNAHKTAMSQQLGRCQRLCLKVTQPLLAVMKEGHAECESPARFTHD